MLTLQTLGSLSLRDEDGNESSSVLSQPKRFAVLLYLALGRPRGAHRRDVLLTLFWPERPDAQARNALSQSLSFLRQNLPEQIIAAGGADAVGLEPWTISSDVEGFEAAIAAGRWEDALDLYGGDFLRGFHVGDAWGFEDWVEGERERLRELAAGAAWALAHEQVERGELVEGERSAQKALGFVWSDETPIRKFIEALARAGDGAAALNLYEKFCRRLREELELEPSPKTGGVAAAIREGRIGGSPSEASEPATDSAETPPTPSVSMEDPPAPPVSPQDSSSAVEPKPATPRRFPTGALLAVAALVTAFFTYAVTQLDNVSGLDDHLVVVPPFENRTGDPQLDDVAILAAEWIGEFAQQVDGVVLVPTTFARQYALEAANAGSRDVVKAVAERAKAGWGLEGVISNRGDSLEFRVKVINISEGREEQLVKEVGPKTSHEGTLDLLAWRVSGALGYEFDPFFEEQERASQPLPSPPKYEALREHRLGYEAYDRQDHQASFAHHMAAYALDSTLVRAVVAAAYMTSDWGVKDSLASVAIRRRHLLTRHGELDLEILLALLAHDRVAQLRAIREMAALEGGGFSSVLQGWFSLRMNLPQEAIEASGAYDPNVEWRRSEAHAYWHLRSQAYHMLGDFESELAEARQGRGEYPTQADLLADEVRALAALGRFDGVLEVLHQASGSPDDPIPPMLVAGEELRAHGFLQESLDAFGMAIDWLRSRPQEEKEDPSHRLSLAEALYGAERWGEAQEVALALAEESPDDIAAVGLVGSTAARLGDSELASKISDGLTSMARPDKPGEHLLLRATIASVLGDADRAMLLLQEAFSESLPFGLRLHREMDFESLRDRGDYRVLMQPKG